MLVMRGSHTWFDVVLVRLNGNDFVDLRLFAFLVWLILIFPFLILLHLLQVLPLSVQVLLFVNRQWRRAVLYFLHYFVLVTSKHHWLSVDLDWVGLELNRGLRWLFYVVVCNYFKTGRFFVVARTRPFYVGTFFYVAGLVVRWTLCLLLFHLVF